MGETHTKTGKGYWFSKNPSKAWGEKFFLIYNAIVTQLGWLNVGNFWHITQNILMYVGEACYDPSPV